MTIKDTLTRIVRGKEPVYKYVCTDCETSFESPNAILADVNCPECRSTRIRSGTTGPGQK
jgi:putative FmdB family regulatory protein